MKVAITTALLAASSPAASPPAVRYAGELGPRLSLTWAQTGGPQALSGKDQAGKPWRITLPGSNSAAVFAADLDHDNQEDLIVIHASPGPVECGTAASDVTVILRDASGRPAPWQSTMRLARTTREEDLPFLLTDRNADSFAEIAVVACAGDAPALEGVYEARPEGVVPLGRRTFAGYASDLKKLYRNKALLVPAEDGPAPAPQEIPTATLDQVRTAEWGGAPASTPQAVLSNGERFAGWPALRPAQAGFERAYSTGDAVTDLLEVAARRMLVRTDAGGLRTYPAGSQTRVALSASLVAGAPVERKIALVEAPVPRSVRDASYFIVAPGGGCFAMHVGSGAVGAMYAQDCDAAASLRAKGLSAAPLVARESVVWQTDPAARAWRVYDAGDLPAGPVSLVLAASRDGQLVGAARAGEFVLAQWRDAASSWLTLHRESGVALTGPLPVPATDQLLAADEARGLVFLRWESGKPALWLEVPARVEWRAGSEAK